MRRHIAIFTLTGRAHTYPVLGLCTELTRRGYRVTYATDDDQAHLIRQAGAEPVIFIPPKLETTSELNNAFRLPASHPDWWVMCATVVYPWLLCTAAIAVTQLEAFYKNNAPDLILYDLDAFAGRILARRLNCRAIQIHAGFFRQETFQYWAKGVCCTPQPMLEFGRILDSFLWAYGINEKDSLWRVEDLNIGFIPREFQYHSDSFDNRYCFVGPCLNRPFHPVWRNNSVGRPIILITDTTGSCDSSYFNAFVDALSGSEYHVILSIGEQVQSSSLQLLPPNFEVNRDASHLEIIPHAALLICQSGTGGVFEALYYGVPMITLPITPFHEEVAYRVDELGLGISLPRHAITSDMIRDSVEGVLGDAALLGRVKEMQRAFRSSGGAAMASDKIEEFLDIGE
jgi:MGT family glycosyltransferase